MFIVYENATKDDKPLKRLIRFKEGTLVQNEKFKVKVDESAPKYLTLNVGIKQKVYASDFPLEILDEDGKVLFTFNQGRGIIND